MNLSDHTTAATTAQPAKQPSAAGLQRQPISAELRQWIIDRAKAGMAPDAVLAALEQAGWAEDVALHAMETTLAEHLSGALRSAPGRAADAALPPAVPVPEPALAQQPLYLDAAGRRITVLAQLHQPRVVVFGSLLSDAECEALIDAARPRLARSLTIAVKTGGEELNADRTSEGMFFERGASELISGLEARIAALLDWPIENGEGLQILRYGVRTEYKPHYDYFDPHEPGTPIVLKRGGQRVGTLIMYLNEPEQGGATVFPDAHFDVAPKRGNAVFFSYDRAHPATKSLHGGAPVLKGEKWIATKWLRERRFD